jgi:hypothetical protein
MELVCPRCGEKLEALKLATLCLKCVEKAYLKSLVEREREIWSGGAPPGDVGLTLERGRVTHIVLSVDSRWTYCGQSATQPRKHRRRVFPEECMAPGICPECRDVFSPLYAAAVQGRAARGG